MVLFRFWHDLTEIQAATLGCSVGNVKSQTARALAKLSVTAELADWGPLGWIAYSTSGEMLASG